LQKLCQRQKKRLPRKGLADVAAELVLQFLLLAGLARSRDRDDRQRYQARLLADFCQGRPPVHDRHSDVEHYHIGFCFRQIIQRFLAVIGEMDQVMSLLEYARHQGSICRVVIHH